MKHTLIYFISILYLFCQKNYSTYFNHAELYNEKSLEKSNSFSARGNAAITDYSGGLSYVYPLFKKKITEISDLNVSLVYNSGISAMSTNLFAYTNGEFKYFKIPATYINQSDINGESGTSHVSVPAWVLNVNGVAVQLFNFNNRFVSFDSDSNSNVNYTTGKSIQRMFMGWQQQLVVDQLRLPSGSGTPESRFKIQILNGDGGMDVFEMPYDQSSYSLGGNWHSYSSSNRSVNLIDVNRKGLVAKLYLDISDQQGAHNTYFVNRMNRLSVTRNDGTSIIYKIDFDIYLNQDDVGPEKNRVNYFHPILYPVEMITKDKHTIRFHYQKTDITIHPVLKEIEYNNYKIQINTLQNLNYATDNLRIAESYKGESRKQYRLKFTEHVALNTTDNTYSRHAMIKEILDPLGNTTKFDYENYQRKYYGLTRSLSTSPFKGKTEDRIQHDLERMSRVTDINGRVQEFTYFSPETTFTAMNVGETANRAANISSTKFEETGREPFSSNMLASHTIKDAVNGAVKEKIDYSYSSNFQSNFIQRTSQGKYFPTNDTRYYTTKKYYDNQNRIQQRTEFIYRQYQALEYWENNYVTNANNPAGAEIKLLEKKNYVPVTIGNSSADLLTSKELYSYDTGNYVNFSYYTGSGSNRKEMSIYDGMFYEKQVDTYSYKNGKEIHSWKRNHRQYQEITGGPDNDTFTNVLLSQGTYNSLGDSSYTKYDSRYLMDSYNKLNGIHSGEYVYENLPAIQKNINTRSGIVNSQVFDYIMPFDNNMLRLSDIQVIKSSNKAILGTEKLDKSYRKNLNAWLAYLKGGETPLKNMYEVLNIEENDWQVYTDYYVEDATGNNYHRINYYAWGEGQAYSPETTINGVSHPRAFIKKDPSKTLAQLIPNATLRNNMISKTIYVKRWVWKPARNRFEEDFIITGTAHFFPKMDMKETSVTGFHFKLDPNAAYYNSATKTISFDFGEVDTIPAIHFKVLNGLQLNEIEDNAMSRSSFTSSLTAATSSLSNNRLSVSFSISGQEAAATNYGIILLLDPNLLTSGNERSIDLSKAPTISNNMAAYYPSTSLLNSTQLDKNSHENTYYIYGRQVRSFSVKESGGTKLAFTNSLSKYDDFGRTTKTKGSKGNIVELSTSSSKEYDLYDNAVKKKTDTVSFSAYAFAHNKMTNTLPTGVQNNIYVDFEPFTGQVKQVINNYDLSVFYDYDNYERIKEIKAAKFFKTGIYPLNKSNYKLPDFRYYEQEIRKEPDQSWITYHGLYEYTSRPDVMIGVYKRDSRYVKKEMDNELNPPALVLKSYNVSKYYHSFAYLDLAAVFASDPYFYNITKVNLSFDHQRISGSSLNVSVYGKSSTAIMQLNSSSVTKTEKISAVYNNGSNLDSVKFKISGISSLVDNERVMIRNLKLHIEGTTNNGRNVNVSYYLYKDKENKIRYHRVTDREDGIGGYHYMRSDYEFDKHYRFSKGIRYNGLDTTLNNALTRSNSYLYDQRLDYSLDVDGNKTKMNYNNRRELTSTESLEGASTSHGMTVSQDYAYLNLAEFNSQSNYPVNPQYTDYFIRKESTDENGILSYNYFDAKEQKLVSIMNVNGTAGSVDYAKIMNVYDNFGNLIKVIHPNAINNDNSINDALCSHYGYDSAYHSMSWKKLADQDTIKYAYDQFGRLRFSQDGKQRAEGLFSYFAYDKLDRPTYNGEASGNSTFNAIYKQADRSQNYAAKSFETNANHLSINHYDKKPLWTDPVWSDLPATYRSYNDQYMAGDVYLNAWRHNRSDNSWKFKGSEKDIFGQLMKDYNYEGDYTVETVYHDYDILSRLTKKEVKIYKGTNLAKNYYQWYSYDLLNRTDTVRHHFTDNKNLATVLNSYNYDRKDRVSKNSIAGGLQDLDYFYNFRGWLSRINNVDSVGTDQFAMSLFYHSNSFDSGANQKNGNISGIISINKTDYTPLKLSYRYDPLNRLISSHSYWQNSRDNLYDTRVSYKDAMGNILEMRRWRIK